MRGSTVYQHKAKKIHLLLTVKIKYWSTIYIFPFSTFIKGLDLRDETLYSNQRNFPPYKIQYNKTNPDSFFPVPLALSPWFMTQIKLSISFVIAAVTSTQPRKPQREMSTLPAEYWLAHFLSWRSGRLENDPWWILKAIHYVHLQWDGEEMKSVRQTRASHSKAQSSHQKHREPIVRIKMHAVGEKLVMYCDFGIIQKNWIAPIIWSLT